MEPWAIEGQRKVKQLLEIVGSEGFIVSEGSDAKLLLGPFVDRTPQQPSPCGNVGKRADRTERTALECEGPKPDHP